MSEIIKKTKLTDDDFNIVKADWIGKIIINYGSGGDEKLGFGGAHELKDEIMEALTVKNRLDHRIRFIRDFLKSGNIINSDLSDLVKELECIRGSKP